MSGVASLFGGLFPGGGSTPNITTPQTFNPFDLNSILNIGLTGPETDLVNFLGGQQDIRTRDIYSRLGLGGSTMEAQDLGGNELQRLAESAQLIGQNQQVAENVAQGTLSAEQLQSSNILQAQQQSIAAQNNAFNQFQKNLSNITGGLGNIVSNFNTSGGAAAANV